MKKISRNKLFSALRDIEMVLRIGQKDLAYGMLKSLIDLEDQANNKNKKKGKENE